MSQRDKMRVLYVKYNENKEKIVRAYAADEVERKSNRHGLTAHQYAERLYSDGIRKGWIRGGA